MTIETPTQYTDHHYLVIEWNIIQVLTVKFSKLSSSPRKSSGNAALFLDKSSKYPPPPKKKK